MKPENHEDGIYAYTAKNLQTGEPATPQEIAETGWLHPEWSDSNGAFHTGLIPSRLEWFLYNETCYEITITRNNAKGEPIQFYIVSE